MLQHNPTRVPPSASLCLAALLAVLTLTACGGEPSSSDIEKAFKAEMEQSAQQLRQMTGSASGADFLPKFHGAKKLGCTSAQSGTGYSCDVEIDVTGAHGGPRKKGVTKVRFVKGSDGWMMTQ